MLDRTKLKIDNINLLLNSYTQSNYVFKLDEVQKKGMYGDFGTLCTSTSLLGQSSSELIAMITNAGTELENNTRILASSSSELALSSTQQASSLEQSSAALEQITSNIRNNNENMNKMMNIANDVNEENYSIGGNENLYATFFIASPVSLLEKGTVSNNRKKEFKELVLKLKPAHLVAFTFINYI